MRTRHQRIRRTRDEAVLRPPARPARPPLPSRPYFPERQVRAALRRSRPSAMPGAAQQHVLRELAENPQPLPRRARLRGRRVDEPVHRKVTHRTAPGPAGGLTALVRTAARPHGRTAARLRRDRLGHICAATDSPTSAPGLWAVLPVEDRPLELVTEGVAIDARGAVVAEPDHLVQLRSAQCGTARAHSRLGRACAAWMRALVCARAC
jgi:hypothetical protein